MRIRINACWQELFCDISWWLCIEFSVRNRVSVNVCAFKMAASRFEIKKKKKSSKVRKRSEKSSLFW